MTSPDDITKKIFGNSKRPGVDPEGLVSLLPGMQETISIVKDDLSKLESNFSKLEDNVS